MSRKRLARKLAGLLLIALSASSAGPAASQPNDLYLETVDVNIVNVEVVVTDGDGRSVTGLTTDDFELLVDGEPVELSNFFEVVGGRATGEASFVPETSDPDLDSFGAVLGSRPETERLQLVILVDERNIAPESRNDILRRLRPWIEDEMAGSDLVMIMRLGDSFDIVQPFTQDRDQLLSAIDGLETRVGRQIELATDYRLLMRQLRQASLATPPADLESPFGFESAVADARGLAQQIAFLAEKRTRDVRATTELIESFARTLAGLRGRKAVLYLSDGLPVRPAESLVEAWLGKFELWISQYSISDLQRELSGLVSRSSAYNATSELRRLVETASRHGVAFYPISSSVGQGGGPVSAEILGSGGGRGPDSLDVSALESLGREDALLRLAGGTGGVAFTRTGNIGGLLEQVRRDSADFYSLGFVRPATDLVAANKKKADDARDFRVEVKVKRDGLKVRHLERFREKDPMETLEEAMLTALYYGFEDNRLDIRLVPGEQIAEDSDRFRVSVMVQVPFALLLLLPEADHHSARVSLVVAVRDDKGRVSPTQRIEFPIQVANDRVAAALNGAAAYPMVLRMDAGEKRISIGMRDNLARVDATVLLELDVGASQAPAVPSSGY